MKYEVMFFSNGNSAVFKDGSQAPELQESWLRLFVEFLKERGVDPEDCNFKMPSGQFARWSDDNWSMPSVMLSGSMELHEGIDAAKISILKSEGKISFIREVRRLTGMGLREVKSEIDKVWDEW